MAKVAMETLVLPSVLRPSEEHAIDTAVSLLREGAVVALPTETVYGLAGDALNARAAAWWKRWCVGFGQGR